LRALSTTRLSSSYRKSLEQWTAKYQGNLDFAEDYLTARGIPLEVAASYRLGVVVDPEVGHEMYEGRLVIPYITRAGILDMKFRCVEDHEKCEDHQKYLKVTGTTHLFNVNAFFSLTDYIAITEGELDAITLTALVGIPAIGVPGADIWKDFYARCFSDYLKVYVVADGDDAGRRFAAKMSKELEGVTPVYCPPGEDVNSLYVQEGRGEILRRFGIEQG
jgi:5S rRNA maturation endonuclease (ribonuclease M5)